MDYAALKAWLTDPARPPEYAAAIKAGNLVRLAALAAAETVPATRAVIPLEVLSAYTGPNGITGTVKALLEVPLGGQLAAGPPPVVMDVPTKAALYTVEILLLTDYRMTTVDLTDPRLAAGVDALVARGVMTAKQKTELLALGDYARPVFGAVTAADVRAALAWGG